MQYFNIQMASQLSGLRSATIRAWEKRYQVVTPERAENKHRLYSELDIEKLTLLAQLTELGQNIGKIAKLDLHELKRVYETVMKRPYQQRHFSDTNKEQINFDKTLSNLSLAINSFKLDIIFHELLKIKKYLSLQEIALTTLPFIFELLQKKMKKGEISLGDLKVLEHLLLQHFSSLLLQHPPRSLENACIISPLSNNISPQELLATELLFTSHQRPYLRAELLSTRELAQLIKDHHVSSLFLMVSDYQLHPDSNLDQYLDELIRFLSTHPQIIIYGPQVLQETMKRKRCHFVTTFTELDLFLEAK